MTAQMPSIWSQMNCTIQGIYDRLRYDDGLLRMPTPPGYLSFGPNITMRFNFYEFSVADSKYAAGQLLDYVRNTNRPHSWFFDARVDKDVLNNLSLIYCLPYVEALHTAVTFVLPDYTIDLSKGPPQPDEADIERHAFSNATMDVTGMLDTNVIDIDNATLDSFFKAVIYGKEGVPIEDLLGRANGDHFIRRMQRIYGQSAVQIIARQLPRSVRLVQRKRLRRSRRPTRPFDLQRYRLHPPGTPRPKRHSDADARRRAGRNGFVRGTAFRSHSEDSYTAL